MAVDRVFIKLRPTAIVDKANIRLKDIADIVTRDFVLARRISNQIVGHTMGYVEPVKLYQSDVNRLLVSKEPELRGVIDWSGNTMVEVRARYRNIDLSPAVDQARAWIAEKIAMVGDIELSVASGGGFVSVPPGVVNVAPYYQGIRRSGVRFSVPIRVMIDGVFFSESIAEFVVRRIVGAARELRASEISKNEYSDQPISRWGVDTHSSSEFVIERNQPVRMYIEQAGVRIESSGVALSNGRIGDSTRVRRNVGGAEFSARVIDDELVLINEK